LVVEDDSGVAAILADVLSGGGSAPTATGAGLGNRALARRLRPAMITLDLGPSTHSGGALLGALETDPTAPAAPTGGGR
jgi:DNA-binding response OmpR family regulator